MSRVPSKLFKLANKDLKLGISIPKQSSTILVCKESLPSLKYQLLMVKRSNKARFMPSFHVFPGGLVEKSDEEAKWVELFKSSKLYQNFSFTLESELQKRDFFSRITALRELFEETNIAIIEENKAIENIQNLTKLQKECLTWRNEIRSDASKFYEMCTKLNILPAINKLIPWTRWTTPKQELYRYDTFFYLSLINSSQSLIYNASHDNAEITEFDWFEPQEALTKFENNNIQLSPPTWIELKSLNNKCENVNALKKEIFNRTIDSAFSNTIEPHIEVLGDEQIAICFEDDQLHPLSIIKDKKDRLLVNENGYIEIKD
eukprot:TRINITY_DN7745_c0_g1_i1.p1 TRINITY_DN7745_c0_g1~~TRINITY_DN7745_c0_g1_i1.p1  ORF type:complete len:318 (-),score=130.38 TRINITY_DN7745_c0_g1_i1:4-957(-)